MSWLGYAASVLAAKYGPVVYGWGARKLQEAYGRLYHHVTERERIDQESGFPHDPRVSDGMSTYERLDLEPSNPNFPRRRTRRIKAGTRNASLGRPFLTARRVGRKIGRRIRRYRRTGRRAIRRYRGRRARIGRPGLRGRRFGRRNRGRRFGRKRMSFKSRVRKITGSCFNQILIREQAIAAPYLSAGSDAVTRFGNTVRMNYPDLFRVCSNWFNTRDEFLRLCSAMLTGPYATAGTGQNMNLHIWPQKVVQTIMLRNPTNTPVMYKLYMCRLKCDDEGAGSSSAWAQADGLPIPSGSNGSLLNPAQQPNASYWEFFDQSTRQNASAQGGLPLGSDAMLATNVDGTYSAPGYGQSSVWEGLNDSVAQDGAWHWHTPLSFIFPNMRKKLHVKCVSSGRIGGYGTRKTVIRVPYPSEVRPRDYFTSSCSNFSKYSYFFFIRAIGQKVAAYQPAINAVITDGNQSNYLNQFQRAPVTLQFYCQRKYQIRAGGDSQPTFGSCDQDGQSISGGWLGEGSGFLSPPSGAGYANPVVLTNEANLGVPVGLTRSVDTPSVPSGRLLAFTQRSHSAI